MSLEEPGTPGNPTDPLPPMGPLRDCCLTHAAADTITVATLLLVGRTIDRATQIHEDLDAGAVAAEGLNKALAQILVRSHTVIVSLN